MSFQAKGYAAMKRFGDPPFDDEAWTLLRHEVIETFTPGTPINEAELFAGRQETIRQLQDTVLEKGRHAIIFGEEASEKRRSRTSSTGRSTPRSVRYW